MKRKGSAIWWGDLQNGRGELSTESGALTGTPYSVPTRFGDEKGSNPEELIGAAHAGCFSMALSKELKDAGLDPKRIDTEAEVTLEKVDGGFSVTHVLLTTRVEAPDADPDVFGRAADAAKKGCPVSRLLNAEIELKATLVN
ncbi:MAG: OsmC family protein [Longimicrobiales bacterium]|nr:OsmC family protein [Longimicrobiales bacterium]